MPRKVHPLSQSAIAGLSPLILCAISIHCFYCNGSDANMVGENAIEKLELRSLNTVKGHVEQDTIVGNFTGKGIDSLYVITEYNSDSNQDDVECLKYFAKSNNPQIPSIELYGHISCVPKLVYEGDIDGDGRDEWGYLHTWYCSQWRQYRIFNYNNGEWRFLYYDESDAEKKLLETSEKIRSSGVDIIEHGPSSGLIKINYETGYPQYELRDTIVKPTYTPICESSW